MMRLIEVGVVLLISCLKVKRLSKVWKTLKVWKVEKVIGLEECLPKYQSSVNLIQRTRSPVKTLIVFQALFAGPKSSLNITFGLIINQAVLASQYHWALWHQNNSSTCCQEILERPAFAIDTYLLPEKYQLWLNPCHYRPVDLMGELIDGYCDQIIYIYGLEEHQLWFNPVDVWYPMRRLLVLQGEFIDGFYNRSSLKGDQLRFNPCHHWLTWSANTNQCTQAGGNYFRYCNLILRSTKLGNWDSIFTSRFWSLRYQFCARLLLHAFKLIAHVSYKEDIILCSRSKEESHDCM